MEETHLCLCCLRCPPDKDLTTPYADHYKMEIYSDMLQDCFNIQMVVDGWGSCGICLTCAGRLRDASDFKLQVQHCQTILRARTPARSHVKEEEPDTELPAEHEDETGYEHVLQELPGPGLADGAGASDDEESTVKQEMITVDEGELSAEPAVRSEAARDEERPQLGAASAVSLRARRQLAAACAVRLERLRAPHKPARRASAPHTYACDMCTQRFNSKSVLIRHIGTHYRCEVCNKMFMMSACLTRHERNCTENKLIKYKLAEKRTLLNSYGEVVMYYCDECGQGFRYKHYLRKHIQRSHMIRQVLYNSHSRLSKRQVLVTQNIHTGEKLFECGYCNYKCSNKSSLQTHQRIHTGEKPFECGYCDFNCSNKSNLRKHQKTHTGEKPFQCGYCDFKCSYKSILQAHQRIHTGEKPFECGYCDYKCSRKSDLLTHQRIHTGEKPFQCVYCDFKSSDKSSLRRHQKIHTGEKPFQCVYCDYKSGDKSTLRRHQMRHTGEKPFACGICDFKFIRKSYLRKHQRIHTGEKPF